MDSILSSFSSLLSRSRSTLTLPGAEADSSLACGLSFLPDIETERSSLVLPEQVLALQESALQERSTKFPEYDEVTLLQYISDGRLEQKIKISLPITLQHFPTIGRGRIFSVKRFPTGWGEEMFDHRFDAPAAAVKCLVSPVQSRPEEQSLRYRCLLQELRILLHEPLRQHFNFVKVTELGWEPDPFSPQNFLPNLCTEYATYGTIQNLLGCVQSEYHWRQRFILDVTEGLSALHKCSILHSDVKVDNVLIFPCEDPIYPLVAKLSDFGFSLELNQTMQNLELIGYTPLWAAPEVILGKAHICLELTDVYSLGFVIWSIGLGGKSPFENSEIFSTEYVLNEWDVWKSSNELVSLAVADVHLSKLSADTNVEEVCYLISATLQADPGERYIDKVLQCLRGMCDRAASNETAQQLDYKPLDAFNHEKIDIRPALFTSGWLKPKLRHQVTTKLVSIASSSRNTQVPTLEPLFVGQKEWRFPDTVTLRATAAAYTLGIINLQNYPETSVNMACHWFYLAAKHGHRFSQAMAAKLAYDLDKVNEFPESEAWLEIAASNGSKSALHQLRKLDAARHTACLQGFRKYFWLRAYDVPENIIIRVQDKDGPELLDMDARYGSFACSALHCAATSGCVPLLKELLEFQTNSTPTSVLVDQQNAFGDTPLLMACKAGHAAAVHQLLALNADAGVLNTNHESGLHWLSSFDPVDMFDIAWALLQGGAQLDQIAETGQTFMSEVAANYFHCLKPGTPLHRAVSSGSIHAVNTLLNLGASSTIECTRTTPLCRASSLHRPDILKLLMDYTPASFDINTLYPGLNGNRQFTILYRSVNALKAPVHYQSSERYTTNSLDDVVKILLRAGAKITVPADAERDSMNSCVLQWQNSALDLLLSHDPSSALGLPKPGAPNINDPLTQAITIENLPAFEAIVMAGASIHATLRFGITGGYSLLHHCVRDLNQNTNITKRLLVLGLNVDTMPDRESSDTPLVYALHGNRFDHAEILISYGASLSAENPESLRGNAMGELLYWEPDPMLLRAIQWLKNNPRISVPFLVNRRNGKTIFHALCSTRSLGSKYMRPTEFQVTFDLLREMFPDPRLVNTQDRYGNTPLHHATASGNSIVVRALLGAGANPDLRSMATSENDRWWRGKTAREIAATESFEMFPRTTLFSRKELDFYTKRRDEIKELL